MKLLTIVAVFLLLEESALSEQVSSGDDAFCPNSKGETYASSSIPGKDYYVCEDGKFIEHRKCPDVEFFNSETNKCEIKHLSELKPIKSEELKATRDLENDFISNLSSDSKQVEAKSDETTQMPTEPKVQNFKLELTPADEVMQFCSSDLDSENACSTAEPNLKILDSRRGNLYTEQATDEKELHHIERPVSKPESGKKLTQFTREVILPLIEDIVNDPIKMSKATNLFKKYIQAIVPLVKEEIKLSKKQTESGSKIPIDALLKSNETASVLREAFLEFAPAFLSKLSKNSRLFLDTLKETSERFEISYFGFLFRYFMLILDSSTPSESESLSSMFGIQSGIEADIETMFKIVKEVTQDEVFSEKFNFITQMFRLVNL